MKLATVVENVVSKNDHSSWLHLLHFPVLCLRAPARRSHRRSLATLVNTQISEKSDPSVQSILQSLRNSQPKSSNPLEGLAARIAAKLEEGETKGAVRLASSEDRIAKKCDSMLAALQEKHPLPHPECVISPCSAMAPPISFSEEDIS